MKLYKLPIVLYEPSEDTKTCLWPRLPCCRVAVTTDKQEGLMKSESIR